MKVLEGFKPEGLRGMELVAVAERLTVFCSIGR